MKAKRPASQLEIGEKLRFMHGKDCGNGLELYQHLPAEKNVSPARRVQPYPLVIDRQLFLPLKRNVPQLQFMTETDLVNAFQEARSKLTMNSHGRSNRGLGELVWC